MRSNFGIVLRGIRGAFKLGLSNNRIVFVPKLKVNPATFALISLRQFSSTQISLAKKDKKSGKNSKTNNKDDKEEDVVEVIDGKKVLVAVEKNFEKCLDAHQKKITEIKLGKSNPKLFDRLKLNIDGKEVLFTAVAQTTTKGGRSLNVTVFDPKNAKTVVSAILASGLNMNPEMDTKNPQLLTVPLPPPTAESKMENLKNLKENFEYFKNNNSNKFSLNFVRSEYLKNFKKSKLDDDLKKTVAEIEKLHKKYAELLNEQFKAAEKSLMK